ncbi:MAG: universal stress protein, partial [Caldisericia bacterium]|nr:universal stress protein [Caldisericia bacterium]
AEALLHMAFKIAKGTTCGIVTPIHVVELPDAIPINSKYTEFKNILQNFETLNTVTQRISKTYGMETEALLIYSRKRTDAIDHFAHENDVDFTIIGWHKSGLAYNMLDGMVPHLLKSTIPSIGIYRPIKNHTEKIRRILFPYTGGLYCKASASMIKRIAKANNSFVTLLNIIDKDSSIEERLEIQEIFLKSLQALQVKGEIKTVEKSTISRTSIIIEASEDYDLLVLGMEPAWGIKETVTGFSTDTVTEHSHCSVLLIREGSAMTNSRFFRKILDSINRI